jgi:hypothetical protein
LIRGLFARSFYAAAGTSTRGGRVLAFQAGRLADADL